MTDVILVFVLLLVVGASIFFTWTLIGLWRSHVPFISTTRKIAQRMVELAEIQSGQKIYDLGCGRGAILFEIAKQDVQCTGYELIRPVVWMANIRKFFRGRYICPLRFKCADFFKEDLSTADVIFCYLWPSIMDRLYTEKWQSFKKGTKIISHDFPIRALTPKKIITEGRTKIYVYEK